MPRSRDGAEHFEISETDTLMRPRRTHSSAPLRLAGAAAAAVALAGCASAARAGDHVATAARPAGSVPLRLEIGPRGSTIVLAPVHIDGRGPYWFILDTGASRTVLDRPLAQALGLRIRRTSDALSGVNASHLAGSVSLARWRVGDVRLPAEAVFTLPLNTRGVNGLLGSDNLRRFGRFTLSYSGARLTLG